MSSFHTRQGGAGDVESTYLICLKTGDHGADGTDLYVEDPDALGRIFVGPYLFFEPELSLILEDDQGVCGYALAALDSKSFYQRYEESWRPRLCEEHPMPEGDPATWNPSQTVHSWYHEPDYHCPEPYAHYPSHMHIDFLARARGHGYGRRMMEVLMERLKSLGSPGVHLGVSIRNVTAMGFYRRLGFEELERVGGPVDGCVYFGKRLAS